MGYGAFSVALPTWTGTATRISLSAEANDGRINWYRNESIHQTACFGPVRTIFDDARPAFGCRAAADVDGDGDLDVVRDVAAATRVTWHRERRRQGAAWTAVHRRHEPADLLRERAADVDGDGDSDVVHRPDTKTRRLVRRTSGGDRAGPWHAIGTPGDFSSLVAVDSPAWTSTATATRTCSTRTTQPAGVAARTSVRPGTLALHTIAAARSTRGQRRTVDLDGDGDLDVLAGRLRRRSVGLARERWTVTARPGRRIRSATRPPSTRPSLDVDADGDLDLVRRRANTATSSGTRTPATAPAGRSGPSPRARTSPAWVDARGRRRRRRRGLVSRSDSLGRPGLVRERTAGGVTFGCARCRSQHEHRGHAGLIADVDLDGDRRTRLPSGHLQTATRSAGTRNGRGPGRARPARPGPGRGRATATSSPCSD